MTYGIEKSDIEKIKKIYIAYRKAYKEEKRKEIQEIREDISTKFSREDRILKKFTGDPTSKNWYLISNQIFGSNIGNRYPNVRKILERFDKIRDKIYG